MGKEMTFKIATWNVNSLRVRLPHVLAWLASEKPDVLALQETKLPDNEFFLEEVANAGYQAVFSGQKTYNGVAILSRVRGENIVTDLPGLDDPQRRVLGMTCNGVRILNVYIPNGESVDSPKYTYKLDWLQKLKAFLKTELATYPSMVVLGDFNIAPDERDVHDPLLWEGKVLFSQPERAMFQELLQLGFHDCFRLQDQPEKSFSWWDYRMNAFKRKMGMRIDHILASSALVSQCKQCYIDKSPRGWERPSDHAPVVTEFLT